MPFWGCSAGSFHSFDWFWKERSCKIVHGSLRVIRKCALAYWSVADFKKKKRIMAGKRVAQNGGAAKVACVSCRLSSSFYPLLLLVSLQEWIHGLFMILGPFLLLKEQSFQKERHSCFWHLRQGCIEMIDIVMQDHGRELRVNVWSEGVVLITGTHKR